MVADLGDWALIARACNPKGIPTLRIDAAFPEISELATTLIRECYGEALYEIKLVSQRESADGKKLLEDIDVLVRRGADMVKAELLSGGVSVRVRALPRRSSDRSMVMRSWIGPVSRNFRNHVHL
ncbi:MAG TPA: hypothetical protein VEL75_08955 [Candidatus Methylomirabilis sp.]|nr:hypothetical protein [Candidatus Methylomirabilis sp.]